MFEYESLSNRQLVMINAEWLYPHEELMLLADATDRSRPDLERQFAIVHKIEADCQAAATSVQHSIDEGDCYVSIVTLLASREQCRAYGRVHDHASLARSEHIAGASGEETGRLLQRIEHGARRGWRYVRAHSVDVPEGEDGFMHVARMTQISPGDFEKAREEGWPR